MKGPVYIAHPYWHKSPVVRATNVRLAAALSSAVNRAGCATISPLQEALGREDTMSEAYWRVHGLTVLLVCRAVVVPTYYERSSGCRREVIEALDRDLPVFPAEYRDGRWSLDPAFLQRVWTC